MKIGLTGTIGSGKSLVASLLEELGAFVIDTDVIAREVVAPDTPGWREVVKTWGEDVLAPDRTLDRRKIADIVFQNESERKKLNGILHPLIGAETVQRMNAAPADTHAVLVVPLLFESGFDKLVERVWVVAADEEVLMRRVAARDDCSAEHVKSRIATQMPQQEKIDRAHVVITNNGSVDETRQQVVEAWNNIEKF